jgi:release factor glutamine methyltransferase
MAAAAPELDPASARALVGTAVDALRRSGSESARLDAELLVGHAFGRDRSWLLAHPEAILDSVAVAQLEQWLARRAAGEPIAYIRGFKEWLSLRVRTDARALIPRPETELLAEMAIAEVEARLADQPDRPTVAWDVGTGSGAVALALALRFRSALTLGAVRLVASDLSPDALELAAENLAAQGVQGHAILALADLLDPAGGSLPLPDLVVANLPYIPSASVDELRVAASFEPRVALDGGRDGLDLFRRLLDQLVHCLAPGGVALLEVGAGQAPAVSHAAAALPWPSSIRVLPDLAGIERVLRIARA